MPSIKPPQKQKNPLDRLADGPDKTPMEKHELEDINELGQETFEKTIRRRWYIDVAVFSFAALSIEFALFSLLGWYAIIPALTLLPYLHQKKWERQTDYGALARAKLAEDRQHARKANEDDSPSDTWPPSKQSETTNNKQHS